MQELPNHISEDLLAAYFAGEATADQRITIEKWRDSDPLKASLLEQYHLIWLDLGALRRPPALPGPLQINVDAAWEKHKTKRNNPVTTTSASVFPRALWIGAAAMLVVTFGLGWMILSWKKNAEQLVASSASATQKVLLADGSSVELNSNSTLIYPEKFSGNSRYVKMTGEAFFEVEPDLQKPFTIEVGEARVTVLGTSFNVEASLAMDTVAVLVQTGTVKLAYQQQELVLTRGQKGVLYKKANSLERKEPRSSGIDQFWRTQTLRFHGQKLPEVIQTINEAYGRQIELASPGLASCSLDVTFENDSFENVVDVIAMTLSLEVERQDQRIILTGSGCASD